MVERWKGHLVLFTGINIDLINSNPDSACTCIFLGPAYRFENSCNMHHDEITAINLVSQESRMSFINARKNRVHWPALIRLPLLTLPCTYDCAYISHKSTLGSPQRLGLADTEMSSCYILSHMPSYQYRTAALLLELLDFRLIYGRNLFDAMYPRVK